MGIKKGSPFGEKVDDGDVDSSIATQAELDTHSGLEWHDAHPKPTSDVDLNQQEITNLGAPSSANSAARKAYVDSVATGLDHQDSVLDRDNGGPPSNPSDGDRYIVDSATGDWSTASVDDVAEYDGGSSSWSFTTPEDGFSLHVEDEDVQLVYNGANWVTLGSLIDADQVDGKHASDLLDKATYDSNDDGKVDAADDADTVGGEPPSNFAEAEHTHTESEITDLSHYSDADAVDAVGAQIPSGTYTGDGTTDGSHVVDLGVDAWLVVVVDTSDTDNAWIVFSTRGGVSSSASSDNPIHLDANGDLVVGDGGAQANANGTDYDWYAIGS